MAASPSAAKKTARRAAEATFSVAPKALTLTAASASSLPCSVPLGQGPGRPQHRALHGEDLDGHVGQRQQDLLLVLELLAAALHRRAGDHQEGPLQVGERRLLGRQRIARIELVERGRHHGLQRLHPLGLERQLALQGPAQDGAGDEEPVDLVGPLEDPVDPLVAVEPLGGVLLGEAVAAVDLHHVVHHVGQHLAAEDLGDGALDGVLLDARLVGLVVPRLVLLEGGQPVVDHPGQAEDQRLGGVEVGRPVGQLLAHGPEARDGHAELLALVGVGRPHRQGPAGRAVHVGRPA